MGASDCQLRLLGGITASGKTHWAIAWAKENYGEILCCDSVTCYQGLDVGSAKPDEQERAEIKHHGINLAKVSEIFGVGRYHDYARQVVDQAIERSVPLVAVGGSGFFMEGFLRPVVDGLEVSQTTRKKVDKWFEEEGLEGCLVRLEKINPSGLGSLDCQNQARVRRALERCMQSGKELVDIRREFDALPTPYAECSKSMIWLDRENEDVERRIERRTEKMLGNGMIEETQEALSQGMSQHPSLTNAVGYREVRLFLEGELNRAELKSAIAGATRKLVSKQRKWFRNRFPVGSRFLLKPEQDAPPKEIPWIAGT